MIYQQTQDMTSHKHLGLYFSNDYSYHEHIEYNTIKANTWQKIKYAG